MKKTTEEKIYEVAIELFAKNGFRATSIRDIAEKVGINSATLYYYINNKNDFLAQIMERELIKLINNAKEILKQANTPEETIESLVKMHVIFHGENKLATLVTDTEYRALNSENRKKIAQLRDEYEYLWRDVIQEGKEKNVFKNVYDVKLSTFAVLAMCTGVVHWYSHEGPISLNEIGDIYAKMTLEMLGLNVKVKKTNYMEHPK